MPFDFDEHLHAPVMDVFGESVEYTPAVSQPGAAALPLTAVFDEHHEIIMDEIPRSELNSAGHSTTAPVLSVRLSDLAAVPRQGDSVVVRGVSYKVWDSQPDGRGWADLVLRRWPV